MNGANWQHQWYRPQHHHQTAFTQPRVQYPQQTYYHQPLPQQNHAAAFPQQQTTIVPNQTNLAPTPMPEQCPPPVFAPVIPLDSSTSTLDGLIPRGTPFPERRQSSSSLADKLDTPESYRYGRHSSHDENSNNATPLPIAIDPTDSEDSIVSKLRTAVRCLNTKTMRYYVNFCGIPLNKTITWYPKIL